MTRWTGALFALPLLLVTGHAQAQSYPSKPITIIVTAAAGYIPPPLLEQLKPGGRMVIPVGPPFGLQHLTVIERELQGQVRTHQLFPVRFVPLAGQH